MCRKALSLHKQTNIYTHKHIFTNNKHTLKQSQHMKIFTHLVYIGPNKKKSQFLKFSVLCEEEIHQVQDVGSFVLVKHMLLMFYYAITNIFHSLVVIKRHTYEGKQNGEKSETLVFNGKCFVYLGNSSDRFFLYLFCRQ